MKLGFKIVGAALMAMAIAAPAIAGPGNDRGRDDRGGPDRFQKHSVPEINGAGASLALALLGGIVLISRERRKNNS